MLSSICPIFCCKDMDVCTAFYTRLGFTLEHRYDAYLIFAKDQIELHFAHNPKHVAARSQLAAFVRTQDVDTWSDELAKLTWKTEGFPRFGAAEDRPWGVREMHILDPDGNLLRVGA